MFLCTTDTASLEESAEATPTTTVDKKNPDMSISLDKWVIADLRRINLKFDVKQYYPVVAPSIFDVTRWILSLANLFPGPLLVSQNAMSHLPLCY